MHVTATGQPDDRFTPRYFAIEQELRARIAILQPHDPLPSDADLCAEFDVSRMTARSAVQKLVQDGLVYRLPGKGTYVAPPAIDRQLSNLRGFTAEMTARGMTPSSSLLEAGLVPADTAQSDALEVSPGTEVLVIRRIRSADGTPLALESATLSARCALVLDDDLESGSLHRALISRGIIPATGVSTVSAEPATTEEARYLGVDDGSPLLIERRLIRDTVGVPMEWTESRYVPGRYSITAQFTVELPRD
ncbi:GntR family transcriptional regulator [Gordonia sp. FQ]|uniref:GntR family transcriptional regulator n=1 Tax=Gordonia sp. FQ TaxID=3446634 RepID=UPI003F86962D